MRGLLAALLLVPLSGSPSQADEPSFAPALQTVRADRADLGVRPERWDTRSKLSLPESLLTDPLSAARAAAALRSELAAASDSHSLVVEAAKLLDWDAAVAPSSAAVRVPGDIPAELAAPLGDLCAAVELARPLLARAVASLPESDREAVLRAIQSIVDNSDENAGDAAIFDAADRFDGADLMRAAAILSRAADAAIPRLRSAAASVPGSYRNSWPLGSGMAMVSGAGDDAYGASDLKDVELLVDLGGDNHYQTPLADAATGQIRLVLDLGRNVSVDAGRGGRAASGVLGIGLLYLPESGRKTFSAGSISAGAGLFGVGGLFAGGPVSIRSGRFSQGAGAYGAGLLSTRGDASTFEADFSAQGFGFTRGAGLFVERGDGANLTCGFAFADPREDKGSTSLCQGVGLGQRAFAAGGVGLAFVEGSSNTLESSYFAQGSGYWHGFGALFVHGDDNRLKARRYDQGAGVHIAAGLLFVEGNGNALVNWGVGAGYGWDYGVGAFSLQGDSNTLYAEWGSGHGDINGRALSSIVGNGNLISLPDFGSGAFKRNAPSYGLAEVVGVGNRIRVPELKSAATGPLELGFDPWGSLRLSSGSFLDPALVLPPTQWPPIARSLIAEPPGGGDAARRLKDATAGGEAQQLKAVLTAAAAFTTDPVAPKRAQTLLFALPIEKAALAVGLVSPDYYDEFLFLRTLIAALGAPAASAVLEAADRSQGTRKAMLLGLLKYFPIGASLPRVVAELKESDWRIRKEAAWDLGYWFDREEGEEPGRLRLLEAAGKMTRKGLKPGSGFEKDILSDLGQKRLVDLYSVLALDPAFDPQKRLPLLETAHVVDPVPPEAVRSFAAALLEQSAAFAPAIAAEVRYAADRREEARAALLAARTDADSEVRTAVVTALGQLGDARDAGVIVAGLEDPAAAAREAAAAALGKLGSNGREAVLKALKAPSPRTRALAAIAAARSSDLSVFKCLARAFGDPDPAVRGTALAALAAVQSPFRPERSRFARVVSRLAREDADASVRATAAVTLARIQ